TGRAIEYLRAQQPHRHANVLFAIVEGTVASVFLPIPAADVCRDRVLVDALPTFDPVGAAGVRQAFSRLLWLLVAAIREQDVSLCKVGCVLIKDVLRESPTQLHEARHLCPR